MSQKKPEKKNKRIYQKWWVWALAIIIIVAGIYFIFHNEIKAYKLGIDVEYLENPRYCQVDSDCTSTIDCEPTNIYNHNPEDGICEDVVSKKYGSEHNCKANNQCEINKLRIGNPVSTAGPIIIKRLESDKLYVKNTGTNNILIKETYIIIDDEKYLLNGNVNLNGVNIYEISLNTTDLKLEQGNDYEILLITNAGNFTSKLTMRE